MAFLDNSGDIILDAVLTETGRKKMAVGNFRITKFALGDDEIDYKLYDINNPSGSAYYDLEILQTPVFEAATAINAGINYGLVSYPNKRLLYLPSIVPNEKIASKAALSRNGVYYLAINDGATSDALIAAMGGAQGGGAQYVLQAGQRDGFSLLLETGLNTTDRPGTAANVRSLIEAQGLREINFRVGVDVRFITAVLGPTTGDLLNNNGGNGEVVVRTALKANIPNRADQKMANYAAAIVAAGKNNILFRQDDIKTDTQSSAIAGPRASWTALNFNVKQLSTTDFSRFGKTNVAFSTLFSGDTSGNTCNYIDTMVTVRGGTTGVSFDTAVRILKVN
ncbi:hypothetical protein CMI37_29525 [Candidatus Pacearchaeota archaeon]|nr:hypothetical protein [Candidatus Pacearchaeota archaeon]|tara:strand:- start:4008 stop:5018 length:1011 start_codon:yes stop_codon:yes gene_type:complete